jgi:hypothetical protein
MAARRNFMRSCAMRRQVVKSSLCVVPASDTKKALAEVKSVESENGGSALADFEGRFEQRVVPGRWSDLASNALLAKGAQSFLSPTRIA